jgi:hypothetical protein
VLTNYTIEPCFTLVLVGPAPLFEARTHSLLAGVCTQKKQQAGPARAQPTHIDTDEI